MTDRFSSAEDVQFNKAAFNEGYHCRAVDGDLLRDNPYATDPLTAGKWLDKSFRAGYADADIDPSAPWNRAKFVERAIAESQALASGLRFTFECGCASTFWAETGQLKGGLSCCKLHEANGQTLPNILERCPMLLVRIGTVAA